MFNHDAAEPTTGGGAVLLPEGVYEFIIAKVEEKKSKNGDPMVNVTCEVLNNETYNGVKVFTNITFLPKDKPGAGMSSHFLKCINQPYQGDITVDPLKWVGEDFKGRIATREYKKKDGTTAKTNDIKEIMASDDVAF